MTTKVKIIVGFSLMMVMMGSLAIFAYIEFDESTDGFDAYRIEARTAVFANAADALLREAATDTQVFTKTLNSVFIDQTLKDIEDAANYTREARKIENDPDNFSLLDEQLARLSTIATTAGLYRSKMLAAVKLRDEETLPAGRRINAALSSLLNAAASTNNTALVMIIDAAYSAYVDTRVLTRAYMVEQHPEVAAQALHFLKEQSLAVEQMEPLAQAEAARAVYANLREGHEHYAASAASMISLVTEAVQVQAELETLIENASTTYDVYTASSQESMSSLGDATRAGNENAQMLMGVGSGAGISIALAFTLWIVISVVRTLRQVSGFASAVAGGDFNAKLAIREKGEIGTMARSIMEIPAVLTNLMEHGRQLAGNIAVGHFRKRFDARHFSGGFSELSNCINNVCDAYTGVLDAIPSPLMTGDKNCSIRFLNKEGQKALGGEHTGRKCADLLKTKACDSQECFARNAISRNGPYANEITLNPQDKRIEASVVAAPLHNPAGEIDGFMEIITDITAMKDAQNTMQSVSSEAMVIADRVAAASEELSAQVEQVSQGSEVQRSRVQSTAAAMTEMNAAVLEVARSASNASEQSTETRAKADSGADLVNKVVEAINEINKVALSLQNNMEELGKQAESIGSVIGVISDIADQTNLLALNAAIEAARAGDAGRGFAVVADEVRKLAEKTMGATQEVGGNIQSIQNSTLANIREVTTAVQSIGDATNLANASGRALNEIVSLAASNSDVVASIAAAAEEQSATSDEITGALEDVNRIVNETTEGMTQASAAVHDLAQTALQLKMVMEKLR